MLKIIVFASVFGGGIYCALDQLGRSCGAW
jgi:hypothetical protein